MVVSSWSFPLTQNLTKTRYRVDIFQSTQFAWQVAASRWEKSAHSSISSWAALQEQEKTRRLKYRTIILLSIDLLVVEVLLGSWQVFLFISERKVCGGLIAEAIKEVRHMLYACVLIWLADEMFAGVSHYHNPRQRRFNLVYSKVCHCYCYHYCMSNVCVWVHTSPLFWVCLLMFHDKARPSKSFDARMFRDMKTKLTYWPK